MAPLGVTFATNAEQVFFFNNDVFVQLGDQSSILAFDRPLPGRRLQLSARNCVCLVTNQVGYSPGNPNSRYYTDTPDPNPPPPTTVRGIRVSNHNCWPLDQSATQVRFKTYVEDSINMEQDYIFANWNSQVWVTQGQQPPLYDLAVNNGGDEFSAASDFAPPTTATAIRGGGVPVPGVHRDYRGVVRNFGQTTWFAGAVSGD